MLNNDLPMVSIIMNCYNSDKYLQEAIDSVYAQTYQNWEIIFWDNSSTDESAKIARSYNDKLNYYCSEKNTNISIARNFAIKCAKGDIVAFLDADDIWLPNKLTKQVEVYNNGALIIYGKFQFIDKDKLKLPQKITVFPSGYILKFLLMKYNPISQGSVAIDRQLLLNYMYDPYYKLLGDFDLWIRLSRFHEFISIDEVVELSRLHGKNTTLILESEWKHERRYLSRKTLKEFGLKYYPLIIIYIFKQELRRIVKKILKF